MGGLTTGGFVYLLIRELFAGLRGLFSERSKRVKLLRTLQAEIKEAATVVVAFITALEELKVSNQTAVNSKWTYRPFFRNAPSEVYRQNVFTIQQSFFSSGNEDFGRVRSFYDALDGYHGLVVIYRERFGGNLALSSSVDPHIGIYAKAIGAKLDQVEASRDKAVEQIENVLSRPRFWSILKKKPIYWPLRVFLFLLLILIPEREAL